MDYIRKYFLSIVLGVTSLFFLVTPALAHVIVYPSVVGIAKEQIFDMSVPTEKDNPTIGIKLMIPAWIHGDVVPNIKPGWTINVVKQGDTVAEIDWTGGTIPPGQRDDFYFQAQAPASEVTLKWKAYQTYQDGSVVAWDHNPTANPEDDSAPPPYSTTKVINDLTANLNNPTTSSANNLPALVISIVAILISSLTLVVVLLKKK